MSPPARQARHPAEIARRDDPIAPPLQVDGAAPPLRASVNRARLEGWPLHATVLLLYTWLAVICTWPLAADLGGQHMRHIDPPFSAWRLARVSHQLVHAPRALFEGNIFWPARRTLAYSDAMLLPGVTAMPLIEAGVPPMAVMNLFTLLGFVASAYGAFLLARSVTGHAGAAVVAGLVFAFAPYRRSHAVHLELQWAQWMPLALASWHAALDRGRARDGLLCGLFVLAQLLSSIYYGLFLGLGLGVVAIVTLAARRGRISLRAVSGLAVAAVLAAACASSYATPYGHVQRRLGERSADETARYSARPVSYLATTTDNLIYGSTTGGWGEEETRLFPGATPVVIAAVALLPPVSAVTVAYGAMLVVVGDASLGMYGRVFPALRAAVPAYRGLRAPARFAVLVQLALGVLAAVGLARLASRWPRWGGVVIAGAGLLICMEYAAAPWSVQRIPITPPPVYQWLASEPPQVTLELPAPSPRALPLHDPFYVYASTWHWQPLVNGYSGHYAAHYLDLLDALPDLPGPASLVELERAGVQRVLVHRALYRPERYHTLVTALDAHPLFHLVTASEDHLGEARVYAFLPGFGPRD